MTTGQLKLPSYGGQALIEGVLMRGSRACAAAFRLPTGEISVQTELLSGIYQSPIRKMLFLRGLIGLWDSMVLGTRYLITSANMQGSEEEKIEGKTLYLTVGISFLIGIGFFFLLPAGVAQGLEAWTSIPPWVGNLIEGMIRLVLLVGYLWGIGKSADITRLFGYHGAEHKTINAFEAGLPLDPESIQTQSTRHTRCGTGFLLTLVVFSIILFAFLTPLDPWLRLLGRLVLLPVLSMISYEYIRFTANHLSNPLVRALAAPSLALQGLTTRPPSLDMLEVSAAAFNAMLALESNQEVAPVHQEAEPVQA